MSYENNVCWYHGKLSRSMAEDILLSEPHINGTFLVRESNSAAGDFVLSVLYEQEVIHYQIRKHGDDAFFSIDEHTISHGLETLIEYYQEESYCLVTKLTNPVVKDPPPHDTRRHGRTNLLHRATKEGNFTVVKELLKCGYRSLEAKNQEGQTAVHLASQLNKNNILEKLIQSGANVNCRDTQGCTPLHYACHRNSPKTIKILIQKGMANPQLRNTKSGWVPLHEAASRGYIDCVIELLNNYVPLRPRTMMNETPSDLARINGHKDCERLLLQHTERAVKTHKSRWYHGTLDRNESLEIIRSVCNNSDGAFLVRYSDHSGYVLTMVYLEQPYHFQIKSQGSFYYIDDGPYLESLEHIVEHYMTYADGLPTKLQTPVPPEPSPPLPETPHPSLLNKVFSSSTLPHTWSNKYENEEDLSDSIHNITTLPLRSKAKHSHPFTLPPIINHLDLNVNDSPQYNDEIEGTISRDNIILQEIIGEGEFGSVYKGVLQTREGFEESVAVKTLRPDLVLSSQNEFIREAKMMMKLKHNCIVQFIGICMTPSILMVQELVPLGSMLRYLLDFPNLVSPQYELKIWASQICLGMQYLEEQRFVHRDLAARNILLSSRYQAKISDFGLSRTLAADREYYRATQGGRWPIKWYAPESYNFGTFSSASDVWSFGVTLWEMYSYGDQPYGTCKGSDVIDLIEKGERLQRPYKCPQDIYQVMERCWAYKARDRPSFSELCEIFSNNPEYTNVKELIISSSIIEV